MRVLGQKKLKGGEAPKAPPHQLGHWLKWKFYIVCVALMGKTPLR